MAFNKSRLHVLARLKYAHHDFVIRPQLHGGRRFHVEELEARVLLAVNVGSHFQGLSYPDSVDSVPPDTMVAAGTTHIVETINTTVAVFDKATGSPMFGRPLADFFASLGPGSYIFDPVVAYDELADRFLVGVMDTDATAQTSFFLFAISNSGNPLDGFSEMHKVNVADTFEGGPLGAADFPRIGWNADAYVLTFNMFPFDESLPNDHVQVLIIAKSSVLDASDATLTTYQADRDVAHYTMVPATMHGSGPGDPMWFVEEAPRRNRLRVVNMTDVLSPTPEFTDFDIRVKPYYSQRNARQLGGGRIDAGDTSILNAVSRDNRLVASQTVGTRRHVARARWYEFDTITTQPTLTQFGRINPGRRVFSYYPSIEIAANHDLGMTFMQSSWREFMSMYVTGRTQNDPPGFMHVPILVKPGVGTYTSHDGRPYAAGDYSGITQDPTDTTSFWAGNEYSTSASSENWGTWITQFSVDSSREPPTDTSKLVTEDARWPWSLVRVHR